MIRDNILLRFMEQGSGRRQRGSGGDGASSSNIDSILVIIDLLRCWLLHPNFVQK